MENSNYNVATVKEKQRMEAFKTWAAINIDPETFIKLNQEELATLKAFFESVEDWKIVVHNTLEMALRSKNGIDYTNDYNKNNARLGMALDNLNSYCTILRQKYGETLTDNETLTGSHR